METKLFEIRDRGTFLPVICVKMEAEIEEERYLLAITGYGLQKKTQAKYILMGKLQSPDLKFEPFEHAGYPVVRSLPIAHEYVRTHWDELKSGDMIDVEFISGETSEKKTPQRLEKFPKGPVI